MVEIAESDKPLLRLIQSRVPLVREPYARIAAELGLSEARVLARLAELRAAGGVVREVSGIFDAASLGYSRALVALTVAEGDLDRAGEVVAAHPGVSHCYARAAEGCDLGLWFTLAVSPESTLGLEGTVEALVALARARRRVVLPAVKTYKLRVRPPLLVGEDDDNDDADDAPPPAARRPVELTEVQRRAVVALQADLPNRPDPFAGLAAGAGMDADPGAAGLLVHAAGLVAAGCMRRYSAVLYHRRAGAVANVMVAWRVDPAAAAAAGRAAAAQPGVSHCYLRPAGPSWPYTLYTMVHGAGRDDCLNTVRRIAADAGLSDRAELWTVREYKKRRVRYFTDDEARWEASLTRNP